MEIIDNSYPRNSTQIALSKMTIEYVTELDCCQSENEGEEDYQKLIIETDDGGGGKFLRLKTGERGWSISDKEELIEIIDDFYNRLKC